MRKMLIFLHFIINIYGVIAQTPATDPLHWNKNTMFSDEFDGNRNANWLEKRGEAGGAISIPQNITYGSENERQFIRFIGEIVNGIPYTGGIVTGRTLSGHLGLGYGYYEIEARVLQTPGIQSGLWPAFWIWHQSYTSPYWYEELDIFEPNNCEVKANQHHVHFWYNPDESIYPDVVEKLFPDDMSKYNVDMSQWHKYAVEWLEGRVTFYLDDDLFFVIRDRHTPFHQNTNVLIDLQTDKFDTPSWWVVCPPDIDNGPLGSFDVNYFRYYQSKYDCGTTVTEILNYNTFNYAVKKSISLSGVSSLTAGQNVSLRATDFIELKAGFEVPLEAELYLDINPCESVSAARTSGGN